MKNNKKKQRRRRCFLRQWDSDFPICTLQGTVLTVPNWLSHRLQQAGGDGPGGHHFVELDDQAAFAFGQDRTGAEDGVADSCVGGKGVLASRFQIFGFGDAAFGLLHEGRLQGFVILHMLRSGVEQEAGRTAADAVIAQTCRIRQVQPVLGPGEGHVAQPPLLLQLLPGVGPFRGENALGQAAEDIFQLPDYESD